MSLRKRARQFNASILGATVGLACVIWLSLPQGERLLMPGPSNIGHEDVQCQYCHAPAPGSFRQQIQANVQYLLGNRVVAADLGRKLVANEQCIACHHRPDDRHPVYRFFEPRYQEVRKTLKVQFCISCHSEHTENRVTLDDIGFCRLCHRELALKEDPLSISHEQLIRKKRWDSCLGCHDFHGNHVMETRRVVADVISEVVINRYFKGGQSPYPNKKHVQASRKPE